MDSGTQPLRADIDIDVDDHALGTVRQWGMAIGH